jgi:hypothetical protein
MGKDALTECGLGRSHDSSPAIPNSQAAVTWLPSDPVVLCRPRAATGFPAPQLVAEVLVECMRLWLCRLKLGVGVSGGSFGLPNR